MRVLFRLCLKWDVLPNTISSTEWHTKAGGRSANMPHMPSATIRVATSICEDRIGWLNLHQQKRYLLQSRQEHAQSAELFFCGRQFGICERCQILASNLMQEALQVPWWSQSRGCCKLHKIWCRLYRRESDQVSCSSCFTLNFTLFHTCFTFTLPNFPSLCHGLPRFATVCCAMLDQRCHQSLGTHWKSEPRQTDTGTGWHRGYRFGLFGNRLYIELIPIYMYI